MNINNIVIVGCGRISRRQSDLLGKKQIANAQLTAVCDIDAKKAKKQYKHYLKNGPSKVTAKLIEQLANSKIGASLLDVGGGIGAIQWWFLRNGGIQTYGVDASTGYTHFAIEYAAQNDFKESSHFILGDFTTLAPELPPVNHVTLDKVICCYPDFEAIINQACSKASGTVSLSYPMDGFVADIVRWFGVLSMKLIRNPFKPYVHRVASVRALFVENGFKLREQETSFPWHIQTYEKDGRV